MHCVQKCQRGTPATAGRRSVHLEALSKGGERPRALPRTTASQATRPWRSRTLPGAYRLLRPLLRRPAWCSAPVACWGPGIVVGNLLREQPHQPASCHVISLIPAPAQDAAAYATGERAALTRAFQLALPGQQALGSLQAGLAALRSSVGADSAALRTAQANLAGTAATLQARAARLPSCVRRVRL